ncbi:hypothetical protein BDW02DRAFT_602818 [Decorospora gaudefroyi]|uniref:LPXTG-domain-containing protein n=1 Tax=Decorospora gaudefroyi TaxID=184978 RepID=A0A6A5JWS6_9PLEO|nr:hypothetical protein BDW02DRAFT_602818 [Decorospora gaudefroyi]
METTISFTPTWSAIAPLMTTWTPPSYCSREILVDCYGTTSGSASEQVSSTCQYVERDHTCGSDGVATRASECFPYRPDPSTAIVYSPALHCPTGWTTYARTLDPAGSSTAICCPSDYSADSYYQSCSKEVSYTSRNTVAYSCATDGSVVPSTLSYEDFPEYTIVWAQQIRLALTSVPTSSSNTARITPADEPTASSTNPAGSPEGDSSISTNSYRPKSGLSTGAIVGIVAGVLALLALVGAGLFLWRRKQQREAAPLLNPRWNDDSGSLPEFVGGNGTGNGIVNGQAQMSQTGLFQPQPELRGPRR